MKMKIGRQHYEQEAVQNKEKKNNTSFRTFISPF